MQKKRTLGAHELLKRRRCLGACKGHLFLDVILCFVLPPAVAPQAPVVSVAGRVAVDSRNVAEAAAQPPSAQKCG